jgi:hypothetical protein
VLLAEGITVSLRSDFVLERVKNSHSCYGSHPNFSGNPPKLSSFLVFLGSLSMSSRLSSNKPSRSFTRRKKGSSSHTSLSESVSESLFVLFLLPELSAMVQKPSQAKQFGPLKFLDDFLLLRRSPSSSLLLELEVEYAELESTSLAPTIARSLPRLSLFLNRRSSLCLFLCLLLWSRLDRYLPSVLDLCL